MPRNWDLFHSPFLRCESARLNFLDALIIKATVNSTTDIKLAEGALVTKMFLDFAKSKSTLSIPTPHLAIIFSCSALSKTSFVNFVALRITTISQSFIWLAKSLSLN